MTAFRRVEWNFSLQHAVEWAREFHVRFPPLPDDLLRCELLPLRLRQSAFACDLFPILSPSVVAREGRRSSEASRCS